MKQNDKKQETKKVVFQNDDFILSSSEKISFIKKIKYNDKLNPNCEYISNELIEIYKNHNDSKYRIYSAILLKDLKVDFTSKAKIERRRNRYEINESDLTKLIASIKKSLNNNFIVNITESDIMNLTSKN